MPGGGRVVTWRRMLPTPRTDPGGLAALAVALIAAVFAAVDPSGVLGDRWAPVVAAGLALVAVLAARARAYAPATVDAAVAQAVAETRLGPLARGARQRPLVADGAPPADEGLVQ